MMNRLNLLQKNFQRGFTLIELMIVVAIIGILASIAIPGYREYVRKAALVDATNAMSSGRALMEQFFQDNRAFDSNPNFVSPCRAQINAGGINGNAGRFVIACAITNGGNGYRITATGTQNVADFIYTVDEQDTRSTVSNWGNGACWITSRNPC